MKIAAISPLLRASRGLATMIVAGSCLAWAGAKANTQISGTGVFDGGANCGGPPAGFEDYLYFTLELSGDFVGCLWTSDPLDYAITNGNTYQEWGREILEGCLDTNGNGYCDLNEPFGTFETSYHFTSKWAGAPFESAQINGRCQHPITNDSGTGDFAGASGRLDFKDDVEEGDFDWRGHIDLESTI